MKDLGDVWTLESAAQEEASLIINLLYLTATHRGKKRAEAINTLKEIFEGDSWDTIKERMNVEGSDWYVWYMDGANKLLSML